MIALSHFRCILTQEIQKLLQFPSYRSFSIIIRTPDNAIHETLIRAYLVVVSACLKDTLHEFSQEHVTEKLCYWLFKHHLEWSIVVISVNVIVLPPILISIALNPIKVSNTNKCRLLSPCFPEKRECWEELFPLQTITR